MTHAMKQVRFFAAISFLVAATVIFGSRAADAATEIAGYIDGIDTVNTSRYNALSGWAYDPRYPDDPVQVDLYVDGTLAWSVSASRYRPDVGAALSVDPYRGFSITLLHEWLDGQDRELRAYSVNQRTGARIELQGSPFTLNRYDPGVTGSVDLVEESNPQDPHSFVRGWAFDNAYTDSAVPIVVYEGSYLTGKMIGSDLADISRTDVDEVYEVGEYHGFAVQLDLSPYAEGEAINVAVYALDRTMGELKFLGDSAYQIP